RDHGEWRARGGTGVGGALPRDGCAAPHGVSVALSARRLRCGASERGALQDHRHRDTARARARREAGYHEQDARAPLAAGVHARTSALWPARDRGTEARRVRRGLLELDAVEPGIEIRQLVTAGRRCSAAAERRVYLTRSRTPATSRSTSASVV